MLCQTPFHSYRWLLRYGIVKIAKNWKICKTAPSGPFSQIRSHFVVFHSCNSCCTVLLATHCQHLHYAVCMYSVVAFTCPGSSLVVMLCSKFWVCAYLPIASFPRLIWKIRRGPGIHYLHIHLISQHFGNSGLYFCVLWHWYMYTVVHLFTHAMLTVVICMLDPDSAVLYAFLQLWGEAIKFKLVKSTCKAFILYREI